MTLGQRQIAFVVDLNGCMGCHTCSVACKTFYTNDKGMDHQWWMKVNTLPGRGYPKDWEQMGGGYDADGRLIVGQTPTPEHYGRDMQFDYTAVFYGGNDQRVHLAPKDKPAWGPNWDEDLGGGDYPNTHFFYLPRLCNHCWRPACAEACSVGAIRKRPEDGVVVVNEVQCEACTQHQCLGGCPYKEVFWNPVRQAAQKCNACLPRMDRGLAPVCVRQCPGRCLWVDYLDNEAGPVYQFVKEWKVALPLHAEFNTGPNVYYIPPLAPSSLDADRSFDGGLPRIPLEYLRSLFGPGVDDALDQLGEEMAKRRRKPKEESALMDMLIGRRWQEHLGPFTNDPRTAHAV